MSEIEIGEYIRTKDGYIAKVVDLNNYVGIAVDYGFINGDYEGIGIDDIEKHSKNIIDLIEVGDYVNRYRVLALVRLNEETISICTYRDEEHMDCKIIKYTEIKSIMTKEQYEQNCYRLEE